MYDNNNFFKLEEHEYVRDINPTEHYLEIAEFTLNKLKNGTYTKSDIKDYIKASGRFQDPKVTFNNRDLNGNRSKESTSLLSYIKDAEINGNILVPSFTTYFPKTVKRSLHSDFISTNIKERSKHKKLAFKYRMDGDMQKYSYHNTIQKTKKIFNNSFSGAVASPGTILFNPSAHYTMTSITRLMSGMANALNESLIAGNRMYKDPETTLNNIATIVCKSDMERVERVMKRYNLYTPTADEVMDYILKSSRRYWKDVKKELTIYNLLKSFTRYERAMVVYSNDLYGIRTFNDTFMREMIGKFLNVKIANITIEEADDIIKNSGGITKNVSIYSMTDDLRGKRPEKFTESDRIKLASHILNSDKIFKEYGLIFKTFLITKVNMPVVSNIRDMVRDVIVLSDTDSTCATFEDWAYWYFGEIKINNDALAVSSVIMFICGEVIAHYIYMFGINMNAPKEDALILEMKNEFTWDVFVNTNVSKHYFANIVIQEGNIYDNDNPKKTLEKKGVNLIAPNAYKPVREMTENMMVDIMTDIKNNGKVSLRKYIKRVIEAEQLIIDLLKKGDSEVLKLEKIKTPDAYKNDVSKSPYFYHMLWNELYSDRYGEAPDPIYLAIKLPMYFNSKAEMKVFIDEMEDREIAERLTSFMEKHGKDVIKTFRMPLVLAYEKGIPKELTKGLDYKRVVRDNCNAMYIVLEALGYFLKEDSIVSEIEGDL